MIFRRTIIAVTLLLLTLGTANAADCLMGRYEPAQRSYTQEKVQLPMVLDWEYTGTKYENNPSSPVITGNTCYFACGDRLYAVDLESGSMKWKYPSDQGLGGMIKSTPAIYNGKVFFGSADGHLYCVNAETGVFQWAYQTRASVRCPPVILDGVIYVGSDDNSLYAIDAETGDAVWQKPFTARDDIAVGVALGSGIAVVACMDGYLYGVHSTSGKLRWKYRMSAAPVRTSPIIVDNVIVMALGNSVYGFSVRSGQLKWAFNLPSEAAATPASAGQDIYVPCRDKKIYSYNIGGRQPVRKWTEPADLGAMPMSSPVVTDDLVFVTGSKGVVAAFGTFNGSLRWRYQTVPSQITTPGLPNADAASAVSVGCGVLALLTDDGVLHCFRPDAADNEEPDVYNLKPENATAMSGVPPIKVSAVIYDIGSGVDFSSVALDLDGQPVSCEKDPSTSTITFNYDTGEDGKAVQKLQDGVHPLTLTAKDYAGNTVTKTWFFIADNSIPPPKRAVPEGKTKDQPKKPSLTPRRPYTPTIGEEGDSTPPPPPPPPMPGGPPGAAAPSESTVVAQE